MHKPLHLEPATVALLGATVLLLVTTQPLETSLAGIEWPTLFFFIGLFVMVGALEETGAIGEVADGVADADRRRPHRRAARHHLDLRRSRRGSWTTSPSPRR